MPTKAGMATVVSGVLALAVARVFGVFELYIVAAAMLALVGCAWLWVVVRWRSLHVRRTVQPNRLHAGSTSTVTLNLANQRLLPTPVARVTDHVDGQVRADANVPPLRRGASTRASYRLPTERRGQIEIGPMTTRITDPFGLASSSRTSARDTHVLVLPRVDQIAAPPLPGGSSAFALDRTPNRVGSSGDEFASLRAYAVGDDLRKVHWPSSARRGELVVRNEYIPEHGQSLVLLDVRLSASDPDTFEAMVSAAASIVVSCQRRGDHMRFVTTNGVDIAASSPADCDAILDHLAIVEQIKASKFSLPIRLGGSGDEAGALIVANDAEPLLQTLPGRAGGTHGPVVVRFHPSEANPRRSSGRLTSGRMIEIEPGADFATAWAGAVTRS